MAIGNIQCKQNPKLHEIARKIERLNIKWDRYTFLCDLFELSAIAISNQTDVFSNKLWEEREKRYKEIMNKYSKDDRIIIVDIFSDLFNLLAGMPEYGFDDYLGKLYMESGTSNKKTGQFFTPFNLSMLCSGVAISESIIQKFKETGEIITLHEPTCGSGGMILAAVNTLWNKHRFNYATNLLVHCGDIDKRCVHMAYLQLSIAGIPAVVKHQNGLTLETWDEWHTPALKIQWSRFRNLVNTDKEREAERLKRHTRKMSSVEVIGNIHDNPELLN